MPHPIARHHGLKLISQLSGVWTAGDTQLILSLGSALDEMRLSPVRLHIPSHTTTTLGGGGGRAGVTCKQ